MARATTQPAGRPRGLFQRRSPISDSEDRQVLVPNGSSGATPKDVASEPSKSRRWRRRGDGRRPDAEPQTGGNLVEPDSENVESEDGATKPKRRRGSRGGRRHR